MNSPWSGLFTRLVLLGSFGVAAPLFALADMHPDYFTHYHCDRADIVLITVVIWLGPPLSSWAFARLGGARLGRFTAAIVTWAFTTLCLAVGVAFAELPPFRGTALAVAAVAALLTPLISTVPASSSAKAGAWLVALCVPAYFLSVTTVSVIFFGNAAGTRTRPVIKAPAPVVIMIFDELPLPSLMTPAGDLDDALFPNFARLARSGTWYRNATTVDPYTFGAVPAMLTGNFAVPFEPPSSAVYPDSLFTLFEGREVEAFEYSTRMLPVGQGTRDRYEGARLARLAAIVHDASLIVPLLATGEARSGARLAEVSQRFQMFQGQNLFFGHTPAPTEYFDQFLAGVPRWKGDGLYYFHSPLPHPPWFLLPGGTYYESTATAGYDVRVVPVPSYPGKALQEMLWTQDAFLVSQGYQRHLLQTQFMDRELGRLLDALERAGLHDRALIIATSDHGAYYGAGSKVRGHRPPGGPAESSIPFLYSVPLIIKYPHQKVGTITDRNVEHLDLLPTIAEALQVQIPWTVRGQPVSAPERPEKHAQTELSEPVTMPREIPGKAAAAASRRQWFSPDSKDPAGWVYRLRPYGGLVGQPVPAVSMVTLPDVTVVLDDHAEARPAWASASAGGYLKGCASGPGVARAPLWLACAHKGRLIAFTRVAFPNRDSSPFLALFPEAVDGRDPALEIFVVTSTPGAPLTLARPAHVSRGPLGACYVLPR